MKRLVSIVRKLFVFLVLHVETAFTPKNTLMFASVLATPREIIEALGEFDLDPCAPMHPLWPTAKIMYNKQDNGLIQNWGGANLA